MKGTSKVIMGATLIMVVTLALVLALILVLLAELYCSLLLRRRRLPTTTSAGGGITSDRANTSSSPSQSCYPHQDQSPHPPLPFGVLQAPRSFLFPTVSSQSHNDMPEPKKHHSQLRHFIQIQTQLASNATPHHRIGLVSASSSSSPPQNPLHHQGSSSVNGTISDKSSYGGEEYLVYISNPIYENHERKAISGFSGAGDGGDVAAPECGSGSPPLFPMKKLPAGEACSVSLRDATTSLGTSGSGSDSHSVYAISSSSSASPSTTSPSW